MTSEATSVEKLIRSKWFVYVVVFFLIIATTGLPYKFQIFKALLGLVIIVLYSIYLLRFLSRKMTLEMDGRYALYFFLYVFAVILSTIMGSLMGLSAPGGSGLYLLILYFIKVGVFLITIDMFKDQKEDVVKAFMIIGTFFAVHGILQFLLAGLGIIHGTDIRLVSDSQHTFKYFGLFGWARILIKLPFGDFYRAHSFFFEPILFAAFLGTNISLIVTFCKKGGWRNAMLILNSICLLFTLSLGLFIAVLGGLTIYSLSMKRMKSFVTILILLFIAIKLFNIFIGLDSKRASIENRSGRIVYTLEVIADGYGLFGTGRNNEASVSEEAGPADQYLRLWVNHGLLGLLSFMAMLIYFFIGLKMPGRYFLFPFLFLDMLFESPDNHYYFWLVMGILYLYILKPVADEECATIAKKTVILEQAPTVS